MNNKIVKARRTLTAIGKKYGLTFDKKHHYYTGNAYVNNKGETLPTVFREGTDEYKLQYIDGCFHPFLVQNNQE